MDREGKCCIVLLKMYSYSISVSWHLLNVLSCDRKTEVVYLGETADDGRWRDDNSRWLSCCQRGPHYWRCEKRHSGVFLLYIPLGLLISDNLIKSVYNNWSHINCRLWLMGMVIYLIDLQVVFVAVLCVFATWLILKWIWLRPVRIEIEFGWQLNYSEMMVNLAT